MGGPPHTPTDTTVPPVTAYYIHTCPSPSHRTILTSLHRLDVLPTEPDSRVRLYFPFEPPIYRTVLVPGPHAWPFCLVPFCTLGSSPTHPALPRLLLFGGPIRICCVYTGSTVLHSSTLTFRHSPRHYTPLPLGWFSSGRWYGGVVFSYAVTCLPRNHRPTTPAPPASISLRNHVLRGRIAGGRLRTSPAIHTRAGPTTTTPWRTVNERLPHSLVGERFCGVWLF